jgi:hemoglobin
MNTEGADGHQAPTRDEADGPTPDGSPFERIGGAATVRLAVDELYKLILADPDLEGYFEGIPLPRLKAHMVDLLSTVLGGPGEYTGRALDVAHHGLGITQEHYDKVGDYLIGILRGADAPDDIVAAVGETLASVSGQIVEHPSTASVPGGSGHDG